MKINNKNNKKLIFIKHITKYFLTSFLALLSFLILSFNLASCSSFHKPAYNSYSSEDNKTQEKDALGQSQTTENKNGDLLNIIVSIPPQAEFVEKVGGSNVNVTVMVPPGADPHTFELKPDQLKELSSADAYFKLGSGIEFEIVWMDRISELNKNLEIFDCSENIDFIKSDENDLHQHEDENADAGKDEDEGINQTDIGDNLETTEHTHTISGNDPHIWLSIKNASTIIENIYEGLSELDPENQNYYFENKTEYQKQLSDLDKEIEEALSGIKNRMFIVYHSAWKYFARDYGLEEIAVESSGKEPTIKEIEQIIELAKANNIKVIFASPQFSTRSAEVITNEIGGRVILIDPLEKNYISNMQNILAELSK